MKDQLIKSWQRIFLDCPGDMDWWTRKMNLMKKRDAEIIKISGYIRCYRYFHVPDYICQVEYFLHLAYLIRQYNHYYMEEEIVPIRADFDDGQITNQTMMIPRPARKSPSLMSPDPSPQNDPVSSRGFHYDRRKAVQYAERWWNDYNPAFRNFEVDCTNYVSQCMLAGNAPMRGYPNRSRGWWYKHDNWSYSWSVAHALRWYLSSSEQGLTAREVDKANQLSPGDVICYDFEGDGKWNHNTIVVARDANGEPLVNAHTVNSRHRYWSYEDSHAWTPECQYKFFKIGE